MHFNHLKRHAFVSCWLSQLTTNTRVPLLHNSRSLAGYGCGRLASSRSWLRNCDTAFLAASCWHTWSLLFRSCRSLAATGAPFSVFKTRQSRSSRLWLSFVAYCSLPLHTGGTAAALQVGNERQGARPLPTTCIFCVVLVVF